LAIAAEMFDLRRKSNEIVSRVLGLMEPIRFGIHSETLSWEGYF
jgi:hypothetical protein